MTHLFATHDHIVGLAFLGAYVGFILWALFGKHGKLK